MIWVLVAYASSEGSDEYALSRMLVLAFAAHTHIVGTYDDSD